MQSSEISYGVAQLQEGVVDPLDMDGMEIGDEESADVSADVPVVESPVGIDGGWLNMAFFVSIKPDVEPSVEGKRSCRIIR